MKRKEPQLNSMGPSQPATIRVAPVGGKDWTFEYPRLDNRVYSVFHASLEKCEAGRYEEAERDLRLLLEAYPEFIDAQHHLAIILSETRRLTQARALWEAA